MANNRPKIGLALSGGTGRAITHIGVLEVLREQGIPVDYITACSSGTLIAASYACGTMEVLKRDWLRLNKGFLFGLFGLDTSSGRGLLRTEKLEAWVEQYINGKKFEEVKPRLGFVCTDILTGEPVVLSLGDIVKAARASSVVPGLFEPVEWGNRLLIDGGLLSLVPTTEAKQLGADIVIGVDIAATRYMFKKSVYRFRQGYNLLRRSLPIQLYEKLHNFIDRLFTKSVDFIFYNQSDALEESNLRSPGMFGILGSAIDLSLAQSQSRQNHTLDCDYLISPKVKHLGKMDFENAAKMLEEGRRATLAAVPEIRRLIEGYEWRRKEGKKLKLRHA